MRRRPPGSLELESERTRVAGYTLHSYVATGEAAHSERPVLLVHGLSVSGRYLLPTARQLAPDFPVYVPDLPGFGRSSNVEQSLNIDELADVLADYMDVLGREQAAFLGNSFGCQVIVNFALRHPTRITHAILVGPTPDPARCSVARQILAAAIDAPREPLGLLGLAIIDYLSAGPRRTLDTLRMVLHDPVGRKLPQVTVPTLVVRGGRDPIVSSAWAERVTKLLPAGRLVVIQEAAHAVNYSHAEALATVVRPFLLDQTTI